MAKEPLNTWRKVGVLLGLGVVLVLGLMVLQQRGVVAEHERIVVELIEAGEHREAAEQLEALLSRARFRLRGQIEDNLVMCWLVLADDVGLSLAESAALLERVDALAPERLTAEHRQILATQR